MESIELKAIPFKIWRTLDVRTIAALRQFQVREYMDNTFNVMVYELDGVIAGRVNQEVEVKYPKNWWQAVKERFFPKVLIKRYPVEYQVYKLTATECYPEIQLKDKQSFVFVQKSFEVVR